MVPLGANDAHARADTDFRGIRMRARRVISSARPRTPPSVTGQSSSYVLNQLTRERQGRERVHQGQLGDGALEHLQGSHLHRRGMSSSSPCCALLIRRYKDVAWHCSQESIFGSVGDDHQLLLYVSPCSPRPRLMDVVGTPEEQRAR